MARAIDADDYKRILEGWIADLPSSGFDETTDTVGTTIFDCICQLDEMPTIDPVKHGEWEYSDQDDHVRCSICGYEHYLGTYHQYERNACPNCTARMDGGEKK